MVVNALSVGGIESFVLRLSAALAEAGYRVGIFETSPWRARPEFVWANLKPGVHRHRWGVPRWLHALLWRLHWVLGAERARRLRAQVEDRYRSRAFQKAMANGRYSVLHSHHWDSDRWLAGQAFPVPWVISMHGSYEQALPDADHRADFLKEAEAVLSKARHIVIAAEKNRTVPELLPAEKLPPITKIYYGYPMPVRTPEWKGHPGSALVFAMLARGHEEKGWDVALETFREVQQQYPEVRLLLGYNDTPYMQQLQREWAGQPGVVFAGFQSDPAAFLQQAHVGLLPTRFAGESLPNSVIEYLANGLPVIASDLGEIKEMLSGSVEESAGILIQLYEDKSLATSALKVAMLVMIKDTIKWEAIQNAVQEAFQKFELNKCCEFNLAVYQKLIQAT